MAQACRLIETAEDEPKLDEIARAAGLSPHHFHRIFKRIAGVTPKAYAAAHRRKRLRTELKRSRSVTEAIHGSGFNSSSRFYASSSAALGMTPSEYRAGGKNTEIRFAFDNCSLGGISVTCAALPVFLECVLDRDFPVHKELAVHRLDGLVNGHTCL